MHEFVSKLCAFKAGALLWCPWQRTRPNAHCSNHAKDTRPGLSIEWLWEWGAGPSAPLSSLNSLFERKELDENKKAIWEKFRPCCSLSIWVFIQHHQLSPSNWLHIHQAYRWELHTVFVCCSPKASSTIMDTSIQIPLERNYSVREETQGEKEKKVRRHTQGIKSEDY